MMFRWETEREKKLRGAKISAGKKLEGIRLMNELQDKVLTKRAKAIRQKLRENNFRLTKGGNIV